MQHLPPESTVATRSDIAGLSSRLDRFDGRLDTIETRLDGLESCLDGLESRLVSRMDRLESRMDLLDDRMDGFHSALREQTRHFILASTGTMVTLTGVAFGAAALL